MKYRQIRKKIDAEHNTIIVDNVKGLTIDQAREYCQNLNSKRNYHFDAMNRTRSDIIYATLPVYSPKHVEFEVYLDDNDCIESISVVEAL
jgi:hypothetical protein